MNQDQNQYFKILSEHSELSFSIYHKRPDNIKVRILEDLYIDTKTMKARNCKCQIIEIPWFKEYGHPIYMNVYNSLNQLYTACSIQFRKEKSSHTCNIYETFFYEGLSLSVYRNSEFENYKNNQNQVNPLSIYSYTIHSDKELIDQFIRSLIDYYLFPLFYELKDKYLRFIQERIKRLSGFTLTRNKEDRYYNTSMPENINIPIKILCRYDYSDILSDYEKEHILQILKTEYLDPFDYSFANCKSIKVVLEKFKEFNLENFTERFDDYQHDEREDEETYFEDKPGIISDPLGIFFHSEDAQHIEIYGDKILKHSLKNEELFLIVLIHELVHAYTISGIDLSGSQGLLTGTYIDKHIVEGTAQYYTEEVFYQLCKVYRSGFFHFSEFQNLTDRQSTPYQWHQTWITNHEKVRYAWMECRNNQLNDKNYFHHLLSK
ncbi:MAG TPA: hypothetical protein PK816_05910 [Candidatus Cloacimonadota bacterium]|nr:hypothetical protein [Candidatus Cloacimonadota bacterium]